MKKIENWKDIPNFESEDEEREFWETHSISPDLTDDFDRSASGSMAHRLHEMRTMSTELDEDTFRRLIQLSFFEKVDPKILILRFITEGLHEEERRTGLADRR